MINSDRLFCCCWHLGYYNLVDITIKRIKVTICISIDTAMQAYQHPAASHPISIAQPVAFAMDDLKAFLDSYQDHLNDLKAPTRTAITALTMLAVEKATESVAAASGIAAVIENHVMTVRWKGVC